MSPLEHRKPIYLDHNATTPCAPEVIEAMLPFFRNDFANASSAHAMGRKAAAAVAQARRLVAAAIGCDVGEVYFTSGATESNNIVLLGLANERRLRNRIVVTEIEHKSVLEPCGSLLERGFEIVRIPTTRDGVADLEAAKSLINENTLLVCVHGANNELGTLQPVASVARVAHARGAFVHCDATQMLGKVPVAIDDLAVDFASFSGHKAYGPKGIGVVFVRRGAPRSSIATLYRGGGHEGQLRPGTLNVPGIVGFAEACRLLQERLREDMLTLERLRDTFERTLLEALSDAKINGHSADRLPGTSSITIPRVDASMLMANIPHVCISDGSACNSGAPEPSHVLLSIGLSRDDAECTIRISFGRGNSSEEAENLASSIAEAAMSITSRMRDRTASPS